MFEIAQYYDRIVSAFGNTPRGVGWSSVDAQMVRFEQLLKLFDTGERFSVLDYGCGTGALIDFLVSKRILFSYAGYDISSEMIRVARHEHPGYEFLLSPSLADYVVASGTFNVMSGYTVSEWSQHIKSELQRMNRLAGKGFGFNMLTVSNDLNLYSADPHYYLSYCKWAFGNVELIHDYGALDFTILVRRNA